MLWVTAGGGKLLGLLVSNKSSVKDLENVDLNPVKLLIFNKLKDQNRFLLQYFMSNTPKVFLFHLN